MIKPIKQQKLELLREKCRERGIDKPTRTQAMEILGVGYTRAYIYIKMLEEEPQR